LDYIRKAAIDLVDILKVLAGDGLSHGFKWPSYKMSSPDGVGFTGTTIEKKIKLGKV
jgi:hypothetical protein